MASSSACLQPLRSRQPVGVAACAQDRVVGQLDPVAHVRRVEGQHRVARVELGGEALKRERAPADVFALAFPERGGVVDGVAVAGELDVSRAKRTGPSPSLAARSWCR
jgi:hypothetical protein